MEGILFQVLQDTVFQQTAVSEYIFGVLRNWHIQLRSKKSERIKNLKVAEVASEKSDAVINVLAHKRVTFKLLYEE